MAESISATYSTWFFIIFIVFILFTFHILVIINDFFLNFVNKSWSDIRLMVKLTKQYIFIVNKIIDYIYLDFIYYRKAMFQYWKLQFLSLSMVLHVLKNYAHKDRLISNINGKENNNYSHWTEFIFQYNLLSAWHI